MNAQTNAINSQLEFKRAPVSVPLSLMQARRPSLTNDVKLFLTLIYDANTGIYSSDFQISQDNSNWVRVLYSNASGLNGALKNQNVFVKIIPAGCWYRILASGPGAVNILSAYELTL